MKITITAGRIAKHLRRHGVAVDTSRSSLSESVYLTISHGDERLRVRGSNHASKPTYEAINGAPDYEFGAHDMSRGDHIDALRWVVARLNITPDAILRRVFTADEKRTAALRAEEATRAAEIAEMRADEAADEAAFRAWAGDRYAAAKARETTRARKRATNELRREWRALTRPA